MNSIAPDRRASALVGAAIALTLLASGTSARAQGRLVAHYTISTAGVSIGRIAWTVDIGETRYTAAASGKASGVVSMLVNGEGTVVAQGVIADGRLVPVTFVSAIADDEGNGELRMSFENGAVKDLVGQTPARNQARVPVTEADRRGVSDPLSAVLIPETAGDALASANCNRVLSIFDGRRRYDLVLSFKRVDKVSLKQGYAGLVLVCGVVLQPISGHRADSLLVKYVTGRRDMEAWFAPIAGTGVIAPVRVVIPTMIGTLEVAADQFAAGDLPPASPAMPSR
jgi:hypothetical protein